MFFKQSLSVSPSLKVKIRWTLPTETTERIAGQDFRLTRGGIGAIALVEIRFNRSGPGYGYARRWAFSFILSILGSALSTHGDTKPLSSVCDEDSCDSHSCDASITAISAYTSAVSPSGSRILVSTPAIGASIS